jgi:hypothetical protein
MRSSGAPKPGADILEKYLRRLTLEEMERDRRAFVDWARDRHRGETVVLLGTGPTLRTLDLGALRGFTTLGCNGIGHTFQPDYYVIIDPSVYGVHQALFDACPGTRILSSFTAGECDIRLYYVYENLVGLEPDDVYSADNSGYVQLSIAYIMGAANMVLAGYDGYPIQQRTESHSYEETQEEKDRVQYEWNGEAGRAKHDLIREAFAYAAAKCAAEGRGLYRLTPSYLLGDLIAPISWEDLMRMRGRTAR